MLYGDPAFRLLSAEIAQTAQAAETAQSAGFRSSARPSVPAIPTAPASEPLQVTRKLTAVLSADAQGYSRLMGDDEEATVRTLTAYREVFSRQVQQHGGRVVDSPGDNILAEFASVVDGLQGAIEIQKELGQANAGLPIQRRMLFRMGLNLGDVLTEGGRIYGDGVNIAARIEGLSDGGGICISNTVYDQVENKLNLAYEDIGPQTVKNISKPVQVYRVLFEATVQDDSQGDLQDVAVVQETPATAGAIVLTQPETVSVHEVVSPYAAEKRSSAGPKAGVLIVLLVGLLGAGWYFKDAFTSSPEMTSQSASWPPIV